MWYYEFNGKPFGPVKLQGIMDALRLGRITSDTLVSHQGTNEWVRLADSELTALTRAALTEPVTNKPLPIITKVNAKGLTKLFWWWIGLTGFSLLGDIIFVAAGYYPYYYVGALVLINLPWVAASVLEYVLLYKYWLTIQDGTTRTTPGKAIGYSFIPFFSIYWLYPAYVGLTKDQNRFIDDHLYSQFGTGIRKSKPYISLGYVFLYWLWLAFMLFLIIGTLIYDYLNFPWQLTFANSQIMLPILIILGLDLILRIVMLIDFYLTTRSILNEE